MMEKWLIVLGLLFLNNVSNSRAFPNPNPNADPVADPVPDPDTIIQVSQLINANGCEGSQVVDEKDEHSEEDCNHWSYPSTNWPSICPQQCAGDRQSPIDFPNGTFDGQPTGGLEYFKGDGPPLAITSVNIKNDGHDVDVSWNSWESPYLHNVSLDNEEYNLDHLHFHWGCENSRGSEHTVEGQSYSMELHLVHYKASYGSVEEAIKHSDGLFVIALFFTNGKENAALKPITDNLSKITLAGTDVDIFYNQWLVDLFPAHQPLSHYYSYKGSLTTPSCNQAVTWGVMKYPSEISQAQLDAFRSLQDHAGNPLCNNYREVQPLNGRTITYNKFYDDEPEEEG